MFLLADEFLILCTVTKVIMLFWEAGQTYFVFLRGKSETLSTLMSKLLQFN